MQTKIPSNVIILFSDATSYANYVFKAFDIESNGSINFKVMKNVFLSHSNVLPLPGHVGVPLYPVARVLHKKLIWTFRVYDLNGDGAITKNEKGNVVVAVYELMGIILMPPVCTWV